MQLPGAGLRRSLLRDRLMMTEAQRSLADYCLYLPDGSRQPCYAPAGFVLVRPGGNTLRFSCAAAPGR